MSKINNTQVDHAKDIEIVMPMFNLIENSDNYFKKSGSLWQWYKGNSAINNNGNIVDFNLIFATYLLNFNVKITS